MKDEKNQSDRAKTTLSKTQVGAMAGMGIAIGAVAAGALMSKRRSDRYDGDGPQFAWRRASRDGALVGRSVTINKPRAELYAYWRDFQNLPDFMENLERVTARGKGATWTIKAPGGRTVDIHTEVTDEIDGERIGWRSVEDSDIRTEGRVTFEDAPGDRGTRVGLVIDYDPPGGSLGRGIAKLFLREPEIQARHDLKRFKMLMETGEIATSARTRDETRAALQQENDR